MLKMTMMTMTGLLVGLVEISGADCVTFLERDHDDPAKADFWGMSRQSWLTFAIPRIARGSDCIFVGQGKRAYLLPLHCYGSEPVGVDRVVSTTDLDPTIRSFSLRSFLSPYRANSG